MSFKTTFLLALITGLAFFGFTNPNENKLTPIPARTIEGYRLMGETTNHDTIRVNDFEISSFVTYKEYKAYLEDIKKDSSTSFYKSQLPDTTMCLPDVYKKYVTSTEYDNYPVLGISWEAAMNYCKWMTLKNNKGDMTYVYRLPMNYEWVDAYDYLKSKSIANDFNQNYSDWTFNTMDESFYDFKDKKLSYFSNFYSRNERHAPNVLRRKQVIGNSYLFSLNRLMDYPGLAYYAFHGYRHIGFRYVKCKAVNDGANMSEILYYWGMGKRIE